MTQKEFSKVVKEVDKRRMQAYKDCKDNKISYDEYLKVYQEWRDLYTFARENNLYVQ